MCVTICVIFFFKQKTAYEMRISDWSSDVCSSDLAMQQRNDSIRPLHSEPLPGGEAHPHHCLEGLRLGKLAQDRGPVIVRECGAILHCVVERSEERRVGKECDSLC